MTSDSKKTIVEGIPEADKKETQPVEQVAEPAQKQEDSQKPKGGGWAVVVGGPDDTETEEDRLRGVLDEQKERYNGLFKINEDLQIKYSGLKREHDKLNKEHPKLTSDPQYQGLVRNLEELNVQKAEDDKKYAALMDQNSQLNKKHNGKYAIAGVTGGVVGLIAGLLFSDCSGSGNRNAGFVQDAWPSELYGRLTAVIDEQEDDISKLNDGLEACVEENRKLSKWPKYCPKPKKEELVCPPVVNECPYIKQY